jgi:hypothetical protein
MSRLQWLSLFSLAITVVGCRSHTDLPTENIASDCLLGAVVAPSSATMHVSDTLRVSVSTRICPGQADQTLTPYQWVSTDTSVASVGSSTGLVLARRSGDVTIVAVSVPNPAVKGGLALHVAP